MWSRGIVGCDILLQPLDTYLPCVSRLIPASTERLIPILDGDENESPIVEPPGGHPLSHTCTQAQDRRLRLTLDRRRVSEKFLAHLPAHAGEIQSIYGNSRF